MNGTMQCSFQHLFDLFFVEVFDKMYISFCQISVLLFSYTFECQSKTMKDILVHFSLCTFFCLLSFLRLQLYVQSLWLQMFLSIVRLAEGRGTVYLFTADSFSIVNSVNTSKLWLFEKSQSPTVKCKNICSMNTWRQIQMDDSLYLFYTHFCRCLI